MLLVLCYKRVWNTSTGKIEEWLNVDVQRYTTNAPGEGPDWMFDYKGIFEGFFNEDFVEEVITKMFYESENATDLSMVRPVTVRQAEPSDAPSSSTAPIAAGEVFQDASAQIEASSSEAESEEHSPEASTTTTNPIPLNVEPVPVAIGKTSSQHLLLLLLIRHIRQLLS